MILLDTHVLVWLVAQPKRLSKAAASAIRRGRRADGLAISAITLWEIGSLAAQGRIQPYGTIEETIRMIVEGVSIRPITIEIAALASAFPPDFPGDPSDRIIGATSRAEALVLVTKDERIRRSPLLKTLW